MAEPSPQIYWTLERTSADQTLPFLQRRGADFNRSGAAALGNSALPQRVYSVPGSIQALNEIDVVSNFQWTKSPQTARYNTPYITLTEKRLLMNSNIANLANSVFAGAGSIGTLLGQQGLVQQGIDAGPESINAAAQALENLPQTISNSSNSIVNNAITQSIVNNQYTKALTDAASSGLKSFAGFYSSYQLGTPVLKPYEFLYGTENTGFQYRLPYFNSEYSNSISYGQDESNLVSGIKGIVENFAQGAGGIVNVLQPGTYIEKAKQFSMGDAGRNITVKFPLLNTGEYKDIVENWQLIFGLIYQNRPGRITRSIIDVPVIYEVYSEGVVYMPFAFINNLTVSFLGSRRVMGINVPIGNIPGETPSTYIQTIIPDAYEVTISLQGMNEESRNFLYTSIKSSRPVTTNTNVATQASGAGTTASFITNFGETPTP
jgi:hypothetical protein